MGSMNKRKEYVIFSVDTTSIRTIKKLTTLLDNLVATNKVSEVKTVIGCFEGKLELSFYMKKEDFKKYVEDSYLLSNQTSVLAVPGDYRQGCTIEYKSGRKVHTGPLCLTPRPPKLTEDFSYFVEQDAFAILKD